MTNCSYCGEHIKDLSFGCRYCNGRYCDKHRLPEDHNCPGLKKHKEKNKDKWEKAVKGKRKKHKTYRKKHSNHKDKKLIKNKISRWLNRREHRRYNFDRRLNYILGMIIPLAIAIVAYAIFYSNAERLNEINFWIFKLGGILILVSVFFIIKYGIRLIKEATNFLKRQRNWLKYLIIILVILLLWQGYVHKSTALNPVFDFYEETNFSLYSPISLGNFSFESNSEDSDDQSNPSISNDNSFLSSVSKFFKSEPERKEECMITFDELNLVRKKYDGPQINWDDRAYNLAISRAKDMYERNYFDHVTPEGKCADDFKKDYGFRNSEFLAENVGGMSYYSKGDVAGDCDEALEGWLNSRGHRYNLLYTTHKSGAIGCYYEICVFFGVNNDGFGAKPCTTGEEGLAFWENIPKQPGEV